jgi:hypothetical protein
MSMDESLRAQIEKLRGANVNLLDMAHVQNECVSDPRPQRARDSLIEM